MEIIMAATIQKPDYKRVKQEVANLHRQFALTAPPINPVKIARELGLAVHFVTFSNDYNNIAGFFDFEENAIYVNEQEYPLRQTFTVAHELGHSIMHKEWAASSEYQMLFRDGDHDGSDPHEKEANAFAAHLLVPRFLLDDYYEIYSPSQLSKLFAVSVPMITNRLSFEYAI